MVKLPDHAFLYPFLFDEPAADDAAVVEEVRLSILQKCAEVVELRRRFAQEHEGALIAAAEAVAQRVRSGGRILTFGCGGSATDAMDAAWDFCFPGGDARAIPALCLTSDLAVITAVANDVGFDKVFMRQLISYGRPTDVALGFSTSGNSVALVEAFREARRQGMLTVSVVGYDGGLVTSQGLADHTLPVHADYIPRIQEVQATIYHTLRDLVEAML